MTHRSDRRDRHGVIAVIGVGAVAAALAGLSYGCADMPLEPIKPAAEGVSLPAAVGDPCTPPDETSPLFSGFDVSDEVIDAPDFTACQSGVCLVNYFQGRVTCPLGQAAPKPCAGPSDTTTCGGGACVESGVVPVFCDPEAPGGGDAQCAGHGGVCDAARNACVCHADADCPDGTGCDVSAGECEQYVCQAAAGCQSAGASNAENAGKSCCVPGSGAPVSVAVCGQCSPASDRDAAHAVYCSCRCGLAEGQPPEPGATFCTCPDDFTCTQIRPYVGLGDESLAGKYCIKAGTVYTPLSPVMCGPVAGEDDPAVCGG
jgi:hypothetical protein